VRSELVVVWVVVTACVGATVGVTACVAVTVEVITWVAATVGACVGATVAVAAGAWVGWETDDGVLVGADAAPGPAQDARTMLRMVKHAKMR
jgi:hypothetical protein